MSDTEYSSSWVQLEQTPKPKENVWGNLEVLTEHVTHSAPQKHNFPGKNLCAVFGFMPLPLLPQVNDRSLQVKCKLCYTKES